MCIWTPESLNFPELLFYLFFFVCFFNNTSAKTSCSETQSSMTFQMAFKPLKCLQCCVFFEKHINIKERKEIGIFDNGYTVTIQELSVSSLTAAQYM